MSQHESNAGAIDVSHLTPFQVGEQVVAMVRDQLIRVDLTLSEKAQLAHALGGLLDHLTTIVELMPSTEADISQPALRIVPERSQEERTDTTDQNKDEAVAVLTDVPESLDSPIDADVPEVIDPESVEDTDSDEEDSEGDNSAENGAVEQPINSEVVGDAGIAEQDQQASVVVFDRKTNNKQVPYIIEIGGVRLEVYDQDVAKILEVLIKYPNQELKAKDFVDAGFGERLASKSSRSGAFGTAARLLIFNSLSESLGVKKVSSGAGSKLIYTAPTSLQLETTLPTQTNGPKDDGSTNPSAVPGATSSRSLVVSSHETKFKRYYLRLTKRGLGVQRNPNGTFDISEDKMPLNILDADEVAPILLAVALSTDSMPKSTTRIFNRLKALGMERITPGDVDVALNSAVHKLLFKGRSHLRIGINGKVREYTLEGHEPWELEDILHSIVSLGYTVNQAQEFLKK